MATHLSGPSQYRTNTQDLGWQDERAEFNAHRENLSDMDRVMSALSGMVFLAKGLSHRNWASIVLAVTGGGLLYRAISGYCPIHWAMGIDTSGSHDTSRLGRRKVHTGRATKIQQAIEIHRPPEELYRLWRSLDNLPRMMTHLESVQVIDDHVSHWVMKLSAGAPRVEWDAEIINEVENQRIGWRSLHGSDIDHAGSVEFKPTGDGQRTRLTVKLQYAMPGGMLSSTMAKWLGGDPSHTLAEDLQQFKEQMEADVPSTTTGP